jgi:hypothetical protein
MVKDKMSSVQFRTVVKVMIDQREWQVVEDLFYAYGLYLEGLTNE